MTESFSESDLSGKLFQHAGELGIVEAVVHLRVARAELLHIPEATVRTQLARSRERLRKNLTEAEEDNGQTAF